MNSAYSRSSFFQQSSNTKRSSKTLSSSNGCLESRYLTFCTVFLIKYGIRVSILIQHCQLNVHFPIHRASIVLASLFTVLALVFFIFNCFKPPGSSGLSQPGLESLGLARSFSVWLGVAWTSQDFLGLESLGLAWTFSVWPGVARTGLDLLGLAWSLVLGSCLAKRLACSAAR